MDLAGFRRREKEVSCLLVIELEKASKGCLLDAFEFLFLDLEELSGVDEHVSGSSELLVYEEREIYPVVVPVDLQVRLHSNQEVLCLCES